MGSFLDHLFYSKAFFPMKLNSWRKIEKFILKNEFLMVATEKTKAWSNLLLWLCTKTVRIRTSQIGQIFGGQLQSPIL